MNSSRANGARSQGPATPEGKRRSSQNAFKHGLLSDRVVLECESPEDFQALLDQHTAHFDPVDDVELGFIEEMASSRWRLRRLWAIETTVMDEALAAEPEGDDFSRTASAFQKLAASPTLALIHRYETRLHMMNQRALRNILGLRASKPEEPPTRGVLQVRWVDPTGDAWETPPAQPESQTESADPVIDESPSQPNDPTPCTAAVPNEPSPISGQSPEAIAPNPPVTSHPHRASDPALPNEPSPISGHLPPATSHFPPATGHWPPATNSRHLASDPGDLAKVR